MDEQDAMQEIERRELTSLLWFFWIGLLIASGVESSLVFLMRRAPSVASGAGSGTHAAVTIALAVLLWIAAALAYRKRLGGGGLATALICWMLAKGSVILSFVMYFLAPTWSYTWLLLGGFISLMLVLRPGKFVAARPRS